MFNSLQKCLITLYNNYIDLHMYIWLQEAPVMEYAQVDKSEKRVSQEKEEPTEEDVYDDTMVEKKASV